MQIASQRRDTPLCRLIAHSRQLVLALPHLETTAGAAPPSMCHDGWYRKAAIALRGAGGPADACLRDEEPRDILPRRRVSLCGYQYWRMPFVHHRQSAANAKAILLMTKEQVEAALKESDATDDVSRVAFD